MNGKDIFAGLGYIDSRYIEEAEFGKFSAGEKAPVRVRSLRRPMLVAALVAVAMLLAGCAVAYVMHMQDVQIGSREAQREVFDENLEFQGYETVTEHVLTLSGLKGSPTYQAAQEWFEFKESYDPNFEKYPDRGEAGGAFDAYAPYNAYTQEMADKVDEIAREHGLKKLGNFVSARSPKCLFDYLGVGDLLAPGSGASTETLSAWYDAGGSFSSVFHLSLPGETQWPYSSLCVLKISGDAMFDPELCYLSGDANWREWNYTTPQGDSVLILRAEESCNAWVLCARPNAMMSLQIEATREAYGDTTVERFPMTDRQLEQAVDAINWKLAPTPGDPALLDGPAVDTGALSQTQNGVTITVKDIDTDGLTAKIRLGVTAPEGTVLPEGGFHTGNRGILSPVEPREFRGGGYSFGTEDDGDGKANTADILVESSEVYYDGEDAYRPGDKWNIFIQDLSIVTWNNTTGQSEALWECEGVWSFEFEFPESCDRRILEFVEEPLPIDIVRGWYPNGDDAFETWTLTSFQLRRFGWDTAFRESEEGAELNSPRNNKYVYVVLKDGTKLQTDGLGVTYPLDEVDHLILTDGTELTPRWVE